MVVDLLRHVDAAGARRDRLALVTPDRTFSYGELDEAVTARAGRMAAEEGVRAGEVLPLVAGTDFDGVVALLASWRAGAVAAPLNVRSTEGERSAAARALAPANAHGALGSTRWDAQAVLWTSGTSGDPRGVLISQRGIEASARASADRLGLGPDDVWLASLSPAHIGGLALITRAMLLGSPLVLAGAFDADSALRAARDGPSASPEHRVTHMSVVPTQLLRMLESTEGGGPPDAFRCALVGGAGTPPDLLQRALDAGWPIALTYGLTEATSQVATAPPALVARKPGTVGAPLPGVEVRISAGDDVGVGEIEVRGPTVTPGYVGTDAVPQRDEHGWLATGDLGRLDAEGHLWVTGRLTDRIVTGGVNVDPSEVEVVLRAHPSVADASVVGLPDPEWGERVTACLVLAEGQVADIPALEAFVRERLGGPRRPKLYRIVDALPLNANGKVDRRAVRDGLSANE